MSVKAQDLLTADQVAARLGVTTWKVNQWRLSGELPAVDLGTTARPGRVRGQASYRYRPADVDALVARRLVVAAPPAEPEALAPRPARDPFGLGDADPLWGGRRPPRGRGVAGPAPTGIVTGMAPGDAGYS